jgi:hypothetical protein
VRTCRSSFAAAAVWKNGNSQRSASIGALSAKVPFGSLEAERSHRWSSVVATIRNDFGKDSVEKLKRSGPHETHITTHPSISAFHDATKSSYRPITNRQQDKPKYLVPHFVLCHAHLLHLAKKTRVLVPTQRSLFLRIEPSLHT